MPPIRKRQKLLSSTRPKLSTLSVAAPKLSSRTTQSIISKHHTLQKQLAQARSSGDSNKIQTLEAEIESNGGLSLYQQASTLGQSKDRGGDTSRVLIDWLSPILNLPTTTTTTTTTTTNATSTPLRILEIGSLSATNALNIPHRTQVRRIDLHSQNPTFIEQQDFMTLSPSSPWQGQTGYDILSLSLVVNYVSSPKARGDMLAHTTKFLHFHPTDQSRRQLLPALFLVLPLPCITNSRYLTEDHLNAIMASLNYSRVKVHRSSKLYYSLWRLSVQTPERQQVSPPHHRQRIFKKTELRSGSDRNNFCIVLSSPPPD